MLSSYPAGSPGLPVSPLKTLHEIHILGMSLLPGVPTQLSEQQTSTGPSYYRARLPTLTHFRLCLPLLPQSRRESVRV